MDHTGTYRPVRLVQLHRHSGIWPPEVIPHSNSKNVIWLQDTLAHGLPSVLTANLVLQWVDWLTTFLGLLPISETAEQSVLTSPSPPISGPRIKSNRRGDIDMSEDAQRTRALCMARERVFDMDYLVASRNWGPYLRVRLDHQGGDNNETDESDDDFDTTPPAADQLLPDWSWLAAARIVASSVLRTYREDVRRRIEDWNNLREGAWLRPGASPGLGSESTGTGGFVAIDIQHSEHTPKRDWAGVEGVWRRLVCWFDYEDLLSFNADQRREASDTPHWVDDSYQEAWIIVPLSLRITGYSPCPIPEFADRPTIHVEGEMGGAEWLQEAATMGLDDQDVRRVHGTVTMLIDGNVRWSITSMDEDNSEDQWASEAIQLGGIGSAMGSLGMWTGVNHEQDDPLGVVWQWRVG
ncbi:hypothetical protein BN946_scf184766.g22 [Trametes cinnabarina]|uniref:Uncharacterized protein n=1 Tax=Pycnoporus cinnabarinus TaxID=5643 RepID=A0A060S5R4_PYCCI|nr:hypothetical protein BN946_scf184766.g22 [Trametes cinnabarina]